MALSFGVALSLYAASPVEEITTSSLDQWQPKVFRGETQYTVVENDGDFSIQAKSVGTASGLVWEKVINLNETPCLNWTWKVENILDSENETVKSGDDFPARMYVIVSGGLLIWNSQALNYVWSGKRPVGSGWPNPYSSNSTMVAAQSGATMVNQWVTETRNVREDFKRFAGLEVNEIDAVAIMTDTDDSGQSATAYYRDIHFTGACDT